MRTKLLLVMISFIFLCSVSVLSDQLVYEHDATGMPISGSFEELLNALRNGDDIKIFYKNGNCEILVKVDNIYYINGIICARTHYSDAEFDADINAVFKTNGKLIYTQKPLLAAFPINRYEQNFAMKWFVEYY